MLCFGPFKREIQNTIVLFGISTVKLVQLEIFMKKKNLNMGQKIPNFGVFGLELKNTFGIVEISTHEFV